MHLTISFLIYQQAKNVEFFSVGIGHDVSDSELLTIANGVQEHVINIDDFTFLAAAIQMFSESITCPSTTNKPGACISYSRCSNYLIYYNRVITSAVEFLLYS